MHMANWYVSTSGSSGNSGTLVSPWDIATGLSSLSIQPGDTVYLRGGTYVYPSRTVGAKGFPVSLQGTIESPITIRPYNDEHVIIDGGITSNLTTFPMHLIIRELEVLVSENLSQTRTSSTSGSDAPNDLVRPWGGMDINKGTNIKLINNVVHHNMQGIGFWGEVDGDSELYGNIIYANGWIGQDRYHGHGIYSQNDNPDWKYINNNIMIDNFSLNMQAYGSEAAHIDRYHVERNLWYRGETSETGSVLIGGANASQTGRILNNVGGGFNGGGTLGIGYGLPGDDYIVTGNRIFEDLTILEGFTNLTKTDNLWKQDEWSLPRTEATNGDRVGIDTPLPTDPAVYFDINAYDDTRANLAILNWSSDSVATVDLSDLLGEGDTYRIMDPLDMYGTPYATGTYSGDIELDLTGNNVDIFVVFNMGAEEEGSDITETGSGGARCGGIGTVRSNSRGATSGGARLSGLASVAYVKAPVKGGGKKKIFGLPLTEPLQWIYRQLSRWLPV